LSNNCYQNDTIRRLCRVGPGPNPAKHDFPKHAHFCKIFLQLCVKFLTILWKMNPTKFLSILYS
jgi:hypothetical protein